MAKNVNIGKKRFQTAAEKTAARKKETHEKILAESKKSPQRVQALAITNPKKNEPPRVLAITLTNLRTDELGLIGTIVLKMTPAQIALYNRLNPQTPIKKQEATKPCPRDKKFNPAKRRAKKPEATPL